jgi:hypothetical protein
MLGIIMKAAFKNFKWIIISMIGAFVGIVFFVSTAQSGSFNKIPNNGTTSLITTNPLNSTIDVGDFITIDVVIQDVVNLFGIQTSISFDPGVVQVVDADPIKDGVQIIPGSCPRPDFIVHNAVSNTLGTVEFAATSLNPTMPCSGNGVIASIQFQAVVDGESDFHFMDWILADPDGTEIPAISQDGFITVDSTNKVFIPIVLK